MNYKFKDLSKNIKYTGLNEILDEKQLYIVQSHLLRTELFDGIVQQNLP